MESWQEKNKQPSKNVAEKTDKLSNWRQREENWCESEHSPGYTKDFIQEKPTNQTTKQTKQW